MTSLRGQLLSRLLLGGALLLGGSAAALHWEIRRALTREFDGALVSTVQSLAALAEKVGGGAKLEYAGEDLPQFGRKNGSEVFLLRALDGGQLDRSLSLGAADLPMRAGSAEAPEFFDQRLPDGRVMRCAGIRFLPHDEDEEGKETKERGPQRKEALLVFGRDRAPLDQMLADLREGLLLVAGGALAALAAIIWWSVRRSLDPVDALGESVRAVNAATLNTHFPVDSLPAELQPITVRLNELLARLAEAFERERRFTATAAHELRTPLAELRTLAEVNLSIPASDAERMESWRDALAATRRMELLAASLLELARAQEPAQTLFPEPIILAGAVAGAWEPWANRAAQRGVVLIMELPADLAVETDAAVLEIVLRNLCGNAAEHAPAGTAVRVNASEAPGFVTLRIQNRAGELAEDDLPHLFERFWRKDPARGNAAHHGLGLALAEEFATLLGGTLSPKLDRAGNFEIALNLPNEKQIRSQKPPALHPDPNET